MYSYESIVYEAPYACHFDLDFSGGELRFLIMQLFDSSLADHPMEIVMIFGLALQTMDVYFPAIMNMTFGVMSHE
jgi:hypothetical protein